jgi:two-component system nitrogen regulation response regulator NtrX
MMNGLYAARLREILEYEDYTVEDVDNGVDGLELIEKNDYDLVLCDIKMNRMDGMEVLTEGLALKARFAFYHDKRSRYC